MFFQRSKNNVFYHHFLKTVLLITQRNVEKSLAGEKPIAKKVYHDDKYFKVNSVCPSFAYPTFFQPLCREKFVPHANKRFEHCCKIPGSPEVINKEGRKVAMRRRRRRRHTMVEKLRGDHFFSPLPRFSSIRCLVIVPKNKSF